MKEAFDIHEPEIALLEYFSGTLSASRQEEIKKWIEQSEENRKIASDIRYLCLATGALQDIKNINSQEALLKVKKKIDKRRRLPFTVWLQRIAAVLVLPLLASTLYLALHKDPVEYVEIKTNPGMIATVNLPDGSRVWLNSKSYLKHPTRFTGDTREVELKGEGYFSVHQDKSKRFIVNTPFHIKAEVLGTEFNLEAYDMDPYVRTTLVSGSVKLTFRAKNDKNESFILKPDEQFIYNAKTKFVKTDKPYIPTQTAWKDGLIILKNTPFEEVLKILSKQFNAEFIVKNSKLYANSFTGPFDGQHLSLILEYFRFSSGIQYRYLDPKVGKDKHIEEKTIIELY